MKKHSKFLEFNGKNILFIDVDGENWIALKPICEALNVDYIRSFKNAKKHPILAPALSKQTMQVSKNDKNQLRNVTCIPEYLIYGWIFSLRSESKELIEYQKTCYELLYNHFHGQIGNRKELLFKRKEVETLIFKQKELLKDNDEAYKILRDLEKQKKALSTELNSLDSNVINQTEMEL